MEPLVARMKPCNLVYPNLQHLQTATAITFHCLYGSVGTVSDKLILHPSSKCKIADHVLFIGNMALSRQDQNLVRISRLLFSV